MNEVIEKTQTQKLDVLIISQLALWPLDQGFRVHGFHTATQLAQQGVKVGISSMQDASVTAPQSLREISIAWPQASDEQLSQFEQGWSGPAKNLRKKVASHQGLDPRQLAGAMALVEKYQPSVVIALGPHGPLFLKGLSCVPDLKCVWYAADDLVGFELSCGWRQTLNTSPIQWPGQWRSRWNRLRLCAAIELLFARGLDGAIGASPDDAFLLRHIAGVKRSITIRNGVDLEFFRPQPPAHHAVKPSSLVFWGRMDFEPNEDAVCWFAKNIWPALRENHPKATWNIVGKNPTDRVLQLAKIPGVNVVGEVADIRPWAAKATAVVLPVQCGAGIKNKLLEAAALGKPIIASHAAVHGLDFDDVLCPAMICDRPQQWIAAIDRLWSDASTAHQMGHKARQWASTLHNWSDAVGDLSNWLQYLARTNFHSNIRDEKCASVAAPVECAMRLAA